jgi:hypothetical protein
MDHATNKGYNRSSSFALNYLTFHNSQDRRWGPRQKESTDTELFFGFGCHEEHCCGWFLEGWFIGHECNQCIIDIDGPKNRDSNHDTNQNVRNTWVAIFRSNPICVARIGTSFRISHDIISPVNFRFIVRPQSHGNTRPCPGSSNR